MCGICGVVYTDPERQPERALLDSMCSVIIHRGPDDRGIGVYGQAGLGMQRLSIIDLAGGSQPLSNEDGTVWIVFNGEVYNFPEIRRELEALGHQFATHSDTETVVHAYEQWGDGCVTRLNGMFAFALWDTRERRLLLARDRVGKKPLYYASDGERLVFGSELKALLQAGIQRQVNLEALYHYLTFQYIPGPHTIWQGVAKLPPAHILTWSNGETKLTRYWELSYLPKQQLGEAEWIDRIRYELTEAVRRRLISDVPLGAFLSGGIDSSIIVALMAQLSSGPVKTFSIGFAESQFDETPYARVVARRYETEHHEFEVSFDNVGTVLPELAWHMDEPMADSSALAVYHLARLTRQYVTVALNGDGGDETFAGYIRYVLDKALDVYRLLPGGVRLGLMPWLLDRVPARADIPVEKNTITALKRLAQASSTSRRASIVAWGSYFSHAMKSELCTPALLEAVGRHDSAALLAKYYESAPARTHLDRTLYADFMLYLPDDLLVKTDRMTMAHSLEGRSPFLDYRVVELAASMPERWKIRGLTQKWLLRRAFADLLPRDHARRVKRGFSIPVGQWFRTNLQTLARDILLDARATQRSTFNPEAVRRLLDDHVAGKEDHGYRIWTLVMLELWHHQFVDASWPLVQAPAKLTVSR